MSEKRPVGDQSSDVLRFAPEHALVRTSEVARLSAEPRGFAERTPSGSLMSFVASLAEASDVTDEELDALKRRIEERDRKREARDA